MAKVTLIGPLRAAAGVARPFDVEAKNIRELLAILAARHPDLAPLIEDGVAVAIDGHIHQDDWLAQLNADSEVHILPPIAGG